MPSEYTQQGLSILRDPTQLEWYIIPLLALIAYVYSVEIEKRNWNVVLAGLAFWGCDWFNEIWNSLIFHFNQFAPVWGAPTKTAFLILIGLNIEICFMFAIIGVVISKTLPEDKKLKVLGIPNRLVIAMGGALFCVIVEVILNKADMLTWELAYWSASFPWILYPVGYLYFFLVCFWVHDMQRRKHQFMAVSAIFGIDALCVVIFGLLLGWL